MTSTLKTNIGIAVVMLFLVMGAFAIDAKADDQPTTEDYANLEDIKANQKVIEENRPAYNRFLEAKGWNEAEDAELRKNGWCTVWAENPADITLERCKPVLHGAADDKQAMLARSCNGDAKCICISNGIYKHDSSWATAGIGLKTNNPGNMRPPKTWTPSVPFTVYKRGKDDYFAKFETLEDGIQANVELYFRHYAKYTNADALVSVWAGGGGNADYRSAVANCF